MINSTFFRIIPFWILFTIVFLIVRFLDIQWLPFLNRDLNGVSWLYSAVALIFSLISAFIIQTLWNRWDRLENAIRGEINSLWEMNMFSGQLPLKTGKEINACIEEYLHGILVEKRKQMDKGKRSEQVEQALKEMQRLIFELSEKSPEKRDMAEQIFLGILNNRNDRMHYGNGHLPFLLYILVILSTFLVIFLSLFIAVSNIWLDYFFTLSIGMLAFFIFIVIEDLNHPFRPGNWHITKDGYRELLSEIK